MTDYIEWKLKLDELKTEQNVYAHDTARALIKDRFDAGGAAYQAAQNWHLLQLSIQQHMDNAKGHSHDE